MQTLLHHTRGRDNGLTLIGLLVAAAILSVLTGWATHDPGGSPVTGGGTAGWQNPSPSASPSPSPVPAAPLIGDPRTVPAVVNLVATVTGTSVHLAWDVSPTPTAENPISFYAYSVTDDAHECFNASHTGGWVGYRYGLNGAREGDFHGLSGDTNYYACATTYRNDCDLDGPGTDGCYGGTFAITRFRTGPGGIAAPLNVIVDRITRNSARLDWAGPLGGAYTYEVRRGTGTPVVVPNPSEAHTDHTFTRLQPGTTYTVAVRTRFRTGSGSYRYSDWVSQTFTTLP
jgi:hypothetical protein